VIARAALDASYLDAIKVESMDIVSYSMNYETTNLLLDKSSQLA